MSKTRSDLRAGLFASTGITILAILALTLPGLLREQPIEYRLRAGPRVDLTGLTPGAPVRVGGMDRGRVIQVKSEQQHTGVGAIVRFSISRDPPLFPGAMARISRNTISQQSSIEFALVGAPGQTREPLPAGTEIVLDEMDIEVGLLPAHTARRLTKLIDGLSAAGEQWSGVGSDARQRFDTLSSAATALSSDIGATWPGLRERGSAVIEQFRALKVRFTAVADEARSAADELRRIRAIADEGGPWPRLREAFGRLGESWSALRDDASRLSVPFEGLQASARRVREAAERLIELFRGLAIDLDLSDFAADLSLTSGQFGKLYDEIYSAPWRALFPHHDAQDQRLDALEDLARAMLRGADEARRAEESIRAILQTGAVVGDQGAEAMQRLNESLRRIDELEQAVWRLRVDDEAR